MIYSEKLIKLAEWLDVQDSIKQKNNNEVQNDLRRIAKILENHSKYANDFAEWCSKYYNMVHMGNDYKWQEKHCISYKYYTTSELQQEFIKQYPQILKEKGL